MKNFTLKASSILALVICVAFQAAMQNSYASTTEEAKPTGYKKAIDLTGDERTAERNISLKEKEKFVATFDSLPDEEEVPDYERFRQFHSKSAGLLGSDVRCYHKVKGSSLEVVSIIASSKETANQFLENNKATAGLKMVPGSVTGKKIGEECYNSGQFRTNPSDGKGFDGFEILMARQGLCLVYVRFVKDSIPVGEPLKGPFVPTPLTQEDIDFLEKLTAKTLEKLAKNVEALAKKETPTEAKAAPTTAKETPPADKK